MNFLYKKIKIQYYTFPYKYISMYFKSRIYRLSVNNPEKSTWESIFTNLVKNWFFKVFCNSKSVS